MGTLKRFPNPPANDSAGQSPAPSTRSTWETLKRFPNPPANDSAGQSPAPSTRSTWETLKRFPNPPANDSAGQSPAPSTRSTWETLKRFPNPPANDSAGQSPAPSTRSTWETLKRFPNPPANDSAGQSPAPSTRSTWETLKRFPTPPAKDDRRLRRRARVRRAGAAAGAAETIQVLLGRLGGAPRGADCVDQMTSAGAGTRLAALPRPAGLDALLVAVGDRRVDGVVGARHHAPGRRPAEQRPAAHLADRVAIEHQPIAGLALAGNIPRARRCLVVFGRHDAHQGAARWTDRPDRRPGHHFGRAAIVRRPQ